MKTIQMTTREVAFLISILADYAGYLDRTGSEWSQQRLKTVEGLIATLTKSLD